MCISSNKYAFCGFFKRLSSIFELTKEKSSKGNLITYTTLSYPYCRIS